jgi:hypothetical protein
MLRSAISAFTRVLRIAVRNRYRKMAISIIKFAIVEIEQY